MVGFSEYGTAERTRDDANTKWITLSCANTMCQNKRCAEPRKIHENTIWTTATDKKIRSKAVIISSSYRRS